MRVHLTRGLNQTSVEWVERHKHTGKVPLIDEAASFVYHLFMLESSVSVNKKERHTQRPKMAMAAVKEGLAMNR